MKLDDDTQHFLDDERADLQQRVREIAAALCVPSGYWLDTPHGTAHAQTRDGKPLSVEQITRIRALIAKAQRVL